METENLLDNSRKKLISKNCDIIAANSISEKGAGFREDTNRITVITRDGIKELPMMSKLEAADALLDEISAMLGE